MLLKSLELTGSRKGYTGVDLVRWRLIHIQEIQLGKVRTHLIPRINGKMIAMWRLV